MTLRKANVSDASSIAAISIEVWIGTYLKRGVSAFFADYALDEFTPSKIERLISDSSQHIVVSENEQASMVSFGYLQIAKHLYQGVRKLKSQPFMFSHAIMGKASVNVCYMQRFSIAVMKLPSLFG